MQVWGIPKTILRFYNSLEGLRTHWKLFFSITGKGYRWTSAKEKSASDTVQKKYKTQSSCYHLPMETGHIILPGTIYDDTHEVILPREFHLSLTVQFLLEFHYMGISVHVADLGALTPTPVPPAPTPGMTESLSPIPHRWSFWCGQFPH